MFISLSSHASKRPGICSLFSGGSRSAPDLSARPTHLRYGASQLIHEVVTERFPNYQTERVLINLNPAQRVQVVTDSDASTDPYEALVKVAIEITVDPAHKDQLSILKKNLRFEEADGLITIDEDKPLQQYHIAEARVNRSFSFCGSCYSRVTVYSPGNSLLVFHGPKWIAGPLGQLTVEEFLQQLAHLSVETRLDRIRTFVQTMSQSRKLTAQEINQILKTINFSGASLEAFKLLAPKIHYSEAASLYQYLPAFLTRIDEREATLFLIRLLTQPEQNVLLM